MNNKISRKGEDLKYTLQRAQQGFAYEVMALEIEIDEKIDANNHIRIDCLTRLLQLYMIAVEHLESKSDLRYKYFNNKIQTLIKRKVVLEEMEKATNKKVDSQTLLEARRKELGERKEEYDLQMYLTAEQLNQKKVQEIVEVAETKIKRFQNKIQNNISSQDKELEQRIKRRKMRSEAGSVQKFKVVKGQVVERNIANQKTNLFFDDQPYHVLPKKTLSKNQQMLSERLGILPKPFRNI